MKSADQGTSERVRYMAVPRTLIFVTSVNPENGDQEVLLLKGAPDKRLWANKYNGLGGHVEADEDVLASAQRELREEAGLEPDDWALRGVIHIDTGSDEHGRRPGVVVFVFRAWSTVRRVWGTEEGKPVWISLRNVGEDDLVDDLYEIVPRTMADGPVFYAHYRPRADGTLEYEFRSLTEHQAA